MRNLARRLKRVWLLRQAVFSLAMAAFIFGCVAFQFHPRTPFGTQCPTAPTVKVKAPVVCCGKVVGYEFRDPAPDEAGFVQCQCAEKSAQTRHVTVPPRLEVFLTFAVAVETRLFTPPVTEPQAPRDPGFGLLTPPPVPPPPIAA